MSLATALVGDRPQVRSMRIEQGVIVLDLVQVGHNDAACCASELATRRWELKGTELIERDGEISGTLSLAVLRGTRWELDAWGFGNEQSALIEQLPTIMFEDGRVSGFGGCNRYFGSVTEEAPGELRFGPLAATKMACIGDAGTTEDRFLQRLQASERFSFWLGQLALDWHDDEGAGTLLFKLTEDAISPAS